MFISPCLIDAVENVLGASSSLDLEAVLDVTLDENGQLTYPPHHYDSSFSPPVQESAKSKDKHGSNHDAPKFRSSKIRLKSRRE
jgi:hypothetical protein